MKKLCQKLTAAFLVCCMLFSVMPAALAAEGDVTIVAEPRENTTITVKETVLSDKEKDLFVSENALTAEIARDYAQMVAVELRNTAVSAVEFYLTVQNPNEDLSMNFVDPVTSADAPLVLEAGETITAKLAIFAQEAEQSSYDNIVLTSHVVNEGKTERELNLTVKGPGLSLDQKVTKLANGNVQVTLTNTGEPVNSLKVVADEALAPYAYFPTAITNYVLDKDGTVTFEVVPEGVDATVSGNLLAKGNGATVEIPVTLTNPNYEIVTGRELAQADNVLAGLEVVDEVTLSDDGKLQFSYTFGDGKTLPVSIGMSWELTTKEIPEDALDCMEVTSEFDQENKKIHFQLSYLMTQEAFQAMGGSVAEGLMLMDSVSNVLAKYDIDIDADDIPAEAWDQLAEDFNDACENSARLEYVENLPDLPPSIRDQYTAALQMQMLLDLLEQDTSGKYDKLKEDLKEKLNEQYEPGVEDPVETLEDTVDRLVENLEDRIKRKYDDFNDAVEKDQFHPPASDDNNETTFDEIKEEEQGSDWSMVTIEEDGKQCTNRGLIDSSFYAKDEYELGGAAQLMAQSAGKTAADIGARVFYTGRIVSEDEYVHFMPVSYTLELNSQIFGTSVNSGLSELNIIELDPTLVRLGQTNRFTRDYDVNPGNHFINTDNVFTILYPADVQLAITDPSQVTTAVPDFDVYRKNIFAATKTGEYIQDPVAGTNYLHISVSNRGGHGGYYKLSVKCGDQELLTQKEAEKYRYLPAFTSRVLKVEADLAVGANEITVTMTDCSGRIKEVEKTNNSATMTLNARSRQEPTVTISPSGQVPSGNVVLAAAVENGMDVERVAFYLDDSLRATIPGKQTSNATYSVSEDNLSLNQSYDLRVIVYYTAGPSVNPWTEQITKETTFQVTPTGQASKWADVLVPEGAQISRTMLLTFHDGQQEYRESDISFLVTKPGDTYALGVGEDVNPKGQILVAYDAINRVLYAGTVGEKDADIQLTADRTLTLENGVQFRNKYLEVYLPGMNDYFELAVEQYSNSVQVPALLLAMYGRFLIDGASVYMDVPATDFRTEDQSFDPASVLKIFKMTLPQEQANYNLHYYYSYQNGNKVYYRNRYLNNWVNDAAGVRTIGAALNPDELPETIKEAYLSLATAYVYGEAQSRYLFIKESDYTENMDLTKVKTNTLSFTAEDPTKLTIQSVNLRPENWSASQNVAVGSDQTILCSPMKYTVDVSFTYDNMTYMISEAVDLTNGGQTVNLTTAAMTASLQIKWAAGQGQYATVHLQQARGNGNLQLDDVSNGSVFKAAPGEYDAYITVYSEDQDTYTHLEYGAEVTLEEGETTVLNLDGQFTGSLMVNWKDVENDHLPGSTISMYLEDLKDANGNSFQSIYSNDSLNACVVFTNTDTGEQITTALVDQFSIYSYNNFTVTVPDQAGTYKLQFVLNREPSDAVLYTVEATAGEGGSISPNGTIYMAEGTNRTFTISASKGYQIADVLVDGKSVGAVETYTIENIVASHTIRATFEKTGDGDTPDVEEPTVPSEPSVKPSNRPSVQPDSQPGEVFFSDVRRTDWFYNDVKYVHDNGLMNGVGDNRFDPNGTTNRAMIVTILWRMEGEPVVKAQSSFKDVAENMWYTEAICWAASEGIVNGYGDAFGPTDSITREQLATILYRYVQYKGEDVSVGENTNILSYGDAFHISEYAYSALQWACGEGLINGADGNLMPSASATRAQCAAILHRMLED